MAEAPTFLPPSVTTKASGRAALEGTSRAQPGGWLAFLPATVVLVSWVDWAPAGLGIAGRAGPYWSAAAFMAALAIGVMRGDLAPFRCTLRSLPHRPTVLLAIGVVASWAFASVGAADQRGALFEAARILFFFAFLFFTQRIATHHDKTRVYLGWVALALIALHLVLLMVGVAAEPAARILFERNSHHSVAANLSRFRGLTPQPMACGSALLLVMGCAAGIRSRGLRIAAISAGTLVVAATLSFATMMVPIAFLLVFVRPGTLRRLALVAMVALALALLWLNVLRLDLGGWRVVNRTPAPSYFTNDLGPREMPVHSLAMPGVRLDFHFTGYALLAARSVTCAIEHPLGVGGRNFVNRCPVWAMNTIGAWASQRSAHNAYAALVAEGGWVTTALTIALGLLLVRRLRMNSPTTLEAGVLAAYLVAGFGGATVYQFPFAALLAMVPGRDSWINPSRGDQLDFPLLRSPADSVEIASLPSVCGSSATHLDGTTCRRNVGLEFRHDIVAADTTYPRRRRGFSRNRRRCNVGEHAYRRVLSNEPHRS